MIHEKSCGSVIYFEDSDVLYLLIQSTLNARHWGFVKGHVELGETERQTAIREIKEEVGLVDVVFLENYRHVHDYKIGPFILKEVVFFIAKSHRKEVVLCREEVKDYMWLPYEKALQKLTYQLDKELLQEVNQKIRLTSL
jgi:bis(5'-nucleosidyl)-tetraphosphatase